ncbi:MAG: DUF962 domain-containing protein [Gammaproteobacteria bacterium]|nr:DUF962 domain-containing protein [Gammaproteobacteria bacterium]
MPETDRWLDEYGERHTDIRLAGVYWVSVLTLVMGTVGMLWSLPVPEEFERISPILNWGSSFLMAAVVYYFIISMALAIGMLPFIFGVAAMQIRIVESPYPLTQVSAALFALSIAGLWLGHRGRGGIRAVFHDIQMMMIAPAWLLSVLYRRLGIPY